MSNQKEQTVAGLVIDLIRIRAAAADLEGILNSALSNASGNPEYDDISRKVRGFREALLCLPEAEPTESQLLNQLQRVAVRDDVNINFSLGYFHVQLDGVDHGRGTSLREAITEAIKNH